MGFKSEIVRIQLAELHLKAFQSVLVFEIHYSFFVTKPGSNYCKSHGATKKDRRMPEVSASLAALGNVSFQ